MTDELRLLQILNARFLHDLSSSVGTVSNLAIKQSYWLLKNLAI